MRIIALKEANYRLPKSRHAYRIAPEYGVMKHLPRAVAEKAVADGNAKPAPTRRKTSAAAEPVEAVTTTAEGGQDGDRSNG